MFWSYADYPVKEVVHVWVCTAGLKFSPHCKTLQRQNDRIRHDFLYSRGEGTQGSEPSEMNPPSQHTSTQHFSLIYAKKIKYLYTNCNVLLAALKGFTAASLHYISRIAVHAPWLFSSFIKHFSDKSNAIAYMKIHRKKERRVNTLTNHLA